MGLDTNRYVGKGKLSGEFICAICRDIIQNPQQINSSCEHIFCTECISLLIERGEILKCPNDRNIIDEPYFKKPSRFWLNTYGKLKLKCVYNTVGCRAVIEIENLDKHENSCEYNSEAIITCKEGCNAEMTRKQASKHNCVTYLKILIDDLALSRPLSQPAQYYGSVYDEIKSIKSQLKVINERLDATIERLNVSLPGKSRVTEKSSLEAEVRLVDLESGVSSSPAPPIKPRRLDPSVIHSTKVIQPKPTFGNKFN